ncbi:GABRQ [Symbiodinium natans]|uniref:GABRQ protein n=1 Tax=Symbiodinium natans TaxID=878477 RepID=A0A812J0Z2_9DINO|nr:GABRQ [Symbiodinium natans]
MGSWEDAAPKPSAGHHAVVKPGFPRWARSPGSCAEKAAEVIAFYQQQIRALEARLAERQRAGGLSSGTSALLSSESQTSPDRTPARRLFGRRCVPGNALPSGSDTSFTAWGAVAAIEWIGDGSVQEMRLSFVGEANEEESDQAEPREWQRIDLFEGEYLCLLRGRLGDATLASWLMWVTSFGRCLTLGGAIDHPVPTFSFPCSEGHEIIGASIGPGGEIVGIEQRPLPRSRQVTKVRRRRSRPARRLSGESV